MVLLSFAVLAALSGCSASKPSLGAISVTDPSGKVQGQLTSVIVKATADVSVAVSSDKPNLGVDWSLQCGGSPTPLETTNVCGTLNPVHVGSSVAMVYTAPNYIPVGSTVTLTARATTDPSVSSSVIITIVSQPITLAWTVGFTPPAMMALNGMQSFAATVSNDTSASGVAWSVTCSSADCGSFTSTLTASGAATTTYTAPATLPSGGTVTVTAASAYDKTKTISATITLVPITVTVVASPSRVPAGGLSTLTATVSWDPTGGGVSWPAPTCTAASCGAISGKSCGPAGTAPMYVTVCTATYTAPTSIPSGATTLPVTVAATSVSAPASDSTATGTAVITVGPPLPISVSVSATPSTVQVNGSTTLTATVDNDFTNAGVNWQCGSGTCNPTSSTAPPFTTTFTAPGTVPAGPIVVSATSIAAPTGDPTGSGSANVTVVPAIAVILAASNPTTITAGMAANFSATVSNEIAPGGVKWAASCTVTSNCGTFTTVGQTANGNDVTYTVSFTAPNSAPWSENPVVTITATSIASQTAPPVQSASAAVNVTPVPYVSFVPFAPTALPISNPAAPSLVSLIAVAANDSSNQGLDWSVCATAATCGQFLITPAVPATLSSQAVSAQFSSKIHVASGQVVSYQAPTSAPAGGAVTLNVASTANASVKIAQSIQINPTLTGTALTGVVMAGNLPVAGAAVQLYQAGNAGNGSAAFPLVISNQSNIVTTDSKGNFAIPAGYTCNSPDSLLYLLASNGNPGGVGVNGQLGLMAALGACANLNSSVTLVVNEVTTVATAWALTPFTGADFTQVGSSASNYDAGLANAFATVNNLVNITTGAALPFTPAGGAFTPPGPANTQPVLTGVVPQAEINTLADAINTCSGTAGGVPGDGSACDNFFFAANVNPPGGTSSRNNEPSSILQALLEVAQYPARTNTSAGTQQPLYELVATPQNPAWVAPFLPNLVQPGFAGPSDWTIALSFTGGGLEGLRRVASNSKAMAIDGSGNLWVANPSISSVSKFTNLGVAVSPYAIGFRAGMGGGFTGGGLTNPNDVAIDPNGGVWALNAGNTLTELDPNGVPLVCGGASSSPYCGGSTLSPPFTGAGNPNNTALGLAIDASGNVWVAESGSPGDVAEYAGFNGVTVGSKPVANGNPLSPAGTGYTNLTSSSDPLDSNPANPNGAIAIDPSGNVWILDQANDVAVGLNSQGALLTNGVDHGFSQVDPNTGKLTGPVLSSTQFGSTMVIDKIGDLFIPDNLTGNQLYELYSSNSTACGLTNGQSCLGTGKTIAPNIANGESFAPQIAEDGAGNFWLQTNPVPGNTPATPAALVNFSPSGAFLNRNSELNGGYGFVAPYPAGSTDCSNPEMLTCATAQSLSVDASGNVWLLLNAALVQLPGGSANVTTAESSILEFVGIATPAVTPSSLGKPGKTP